MEEFVQSTVLDTCVSVLQVIQATAVKLLHVQTHPVSMVVFALLMEQVQSVTVHLASVVKTVKSLPVVLVPVKIVECVQ